MVYIKQYGAPRTGTNYVKWVIQVNWPDEARVLSNILGSKHGPYLEKMDWSGKGWIPKKAGIPQLVKAVTPEIRQAYDNGELRYVVIIKDPYCYYWSNKRLFYQKGCSKKGIQHLTTAWNKLYLNWWDLVVNKRPAQSIIIRHEDLLEDLKGTLDKVAKKCQLPIQDSYKNTTKQMRTLNDAKWHTEKPLNSKRKRLDPTFYTERKYLKQLRDEEVGIITKFLDRSLMDEFRYEIVKR